MNTQNTPVHIRLWHKDFWFLVTADLLLTMSVYMLLVVMPLWLTERLSLSSVQAGLAMAAAGAGLYLLGAQCSWLVQRFRRNVVCLWAIVALTLDTALLWYIDCRQPQMGTLWVIVLQRLLLGTTFGLAEMVLASTLIIDTCESFQRTEANYIAGWFSRFALPLGPLAGLLLYGAQGFQGVVLGAVGCSAAALLLIKLVDFPFRTPSDNVQKVSLDRFLLPHGMLLFANLLLVSLTAGLLLSLPLGTTFHALTALGFLLAIAAQHFVFPDAELKSEIVSGLILVTAALLTMLTYPASPVAPVLVGLGVGLVTSRFLLFFIKLSRHCQRGTSQSTYFLAWETGIAIGLGTGYAAFHDHPQGALYAALALTVAGLTLYHLLTHRWFLNNKNR